MWAFALEEVQTMRYVSGRTKHESRGQQNGSPIEESMNSFHVLGNVSGTLGVYVSTYNMKMQFIM